MYNVEQLSIVTPKTQAIRIAHTVGRRKRGGILAEARRKRMVVLNLREPTEAREEKPAEKKEEEKAEEAEVEEPKELAETEKPKPEEKTRKRRRRAKEQ